MPGYVSLIQAMEAMDLGSILRAALQLGGKTTTSSGPGGADAGAGEGGIDWVVVVPELSFVVPQNLRAALTALDPTRPTMVGRRRPTPVGMHYDMRGGIVLSRRAAELVLDRPRQRGGTGTNAAQAADLVLEAGAGGAAGSGAGPGRGGSGSGGGGGGGGGGEGGNTRGGELGGGLIVDDPAMMVETPAGRQARARPGYSYVHPPIYASTIPCNIDMSWRAAQHRTLDNDLRQLTVTHYLVRSSLAHQTSVSGEMAR